MVVVRGESVGDWHGGRVRARWTYGVAIAVPAGRQFVAETSVEPMVVTPQSSHRHPGYPSDSLQQDPVDQQQFWALRFRRGHMITVV